jgi:hypothetical protein
MCDDSCEAAWAMGVGIGLELASGSLAATDGGGLGGGRESHPPCPATVLAAGLDDCRCMFFTM